MERTDTPINFLKPGENFNKDSLDGEGQSWNEFAGSKHLRPKI